MSATCSTYIDFFACVQVAVNIQPVLVPQKVHEFWHPPSLDERELRSQRLIVSPPVRSDQLRLLRTNRTTGAYFLCRVTLPVNSTKFCPVAWSCKASLLVNDDNILCATITEIKNSVMSQALYEYLHIIRCHETKPDQLAVCAKRLIGRISYKALPTTRVVRNNRIRFEHD